MIGLPFMMSCKLVMSHTLPNKWTAIKASSWEDFLDTSSEERQYVLGSTSMKQAVHPAALIALKTTGQQ
jgi:hypothetical protein